MVRQTTPADLRRWIEHHRTAEEREREDRRGKPLSAEESFARAMELIDLAAELSGWPVADDAVTRRLDERRNAAWRTLRERLLPR